MIIPIGVDCGVSGLFKKYGLRTASFPFDWTVTYNGVSDCISDRFQSFIPTLGSKINDHDVYFNHDFASATYAEDVVKYDRRCQRLLSLLDSTSETVIFCRKGHAKHHHDEHAGKYQKIRNDIDDAERLHAILADRYPNLKYRILVFIVCGQCFDANETYQSSSHKIELYNIVTPTFDDERFEKSVRDVLGF